MLGVAPGEVAMIDARRAYTLKRRGRMPAWLDDVRPESN